MLLVSRSLKSGRWRRRNIKFFLTTTFFRGCIGERSLVLPDTSRSGIDIGRLRRRGPIISTTEKKARHFGVWHFSAPHPLTTNFGHNLTPKYTYIFKSCQVVGWYILSCLEVYSAPYPLTNREPECIGGPYMSETVGIYLYFPS